MGMYIVCMLFRLYNGISLTRFNNKTTQHGKTNLTNTVIIVPDITLRGYTYGQKQPTTALPQVNIN